MTIDELFAQGHTAMRLPKWAIPSDHITVDVHEGTLGPWVHLHSVLMDEPMSILITEASLHTDYEAYEVAA